MGWAVVIIWVVAVIVVASLIGWQAKGRPLTGFLLGAFLGWIGRRGAVAFPGRGGAAVKITVSRRQAVAAAVIVPVLAAAAAARPAAATAASNPALDWTQYLHGPQHDSVSAATAFTTSNAASAREVWHWQPPSISGKPTPRLDASPTVAAGLVYIGAESGGFYALNETTGKVAWSRVLDTQPTGTCAARGITSTAAVAPDPVTGTSITYVSGARYLYALNATTGAVVWKTEIGPASAVADSYYNWSSPTVAGGHIYVAMASGCDNPLIRGGLVELDQHTGHVLATWYAVPAGSVGGSIWSSAAASSSGGDVWVSTGNECDPTVDTCPAGNQDGYSLSLVHLSGSLALQQATQLVTPGGGHDWDFGASPVLFGSGSPVPSTVGACNKDGVFYALAANPLSSAPGWTDTIGAPSGNGNMCLAAAVWDDPAGALYIGGNPTVIGGTSYGGSVRQVNPATGAYIWQTGLPCSVMGTPSLDSAGVLSVGTYICPSGATPGAYLINASTGAILKSLPVGGGHVFSQPVFAQGTLFVATETKGLYNFAP